MDRASNERTTFVCCTNIQQLQNESMYKSYLRCLSTCSACVSTSHHITSRHAHFLIRLVTWKLKQVECSFHVTSQMRRWWWQVEHPNIWFKQTSDCEFERDGKLSLSWQDQTKMSQVSLISTTSNCIPHPADDKCNATPAAWGKNKDARWSTRNVCSVSFATNDRSVK